MAGKVSRDRGYRSDTIAISRDMGPLSSVLLPVIVLPLNLSQGLFCPLFTCDRPALI